MKKTLKIIFITSVILLIMAGCGTGEHTPPKVYSIETLIEEFGPVAKEAFGENTYLDYVSYSLNDEPGSLIFLSFLSDKHPDRILILFVYKDGTYRLDNVATGTNHIAPPPLTDFMDIGSNRALEIFYEDETVQKRLNRFSPYSLSFEFYYGRCAHPIWILTLGDITNGTTYYVLDSTTLEVWEKEDYINSEDYKQNCPH